MTVFEYTLTMLHRAADGGYSWPVSPAEAAAVVAEVERLRGERGDTVAWLRGQAEMAYDNTDAHHALWLAANAIERGEHRSEEDK